MCRDLGSWISKSKPRGGPPTGTSLEGAYAKYVLAVSILFCTFQCYVKLCPVPLNLSCGSTAGCAKVQQRGIEGTKTILTKLLQGLTLQDGQPILVVDCLPNRLLGLN